MKYLSIVCLALSVTCCLSAPALPQPLTNSNQTLQKGDEQKIPSVAAVKVDGDAPKTGPQEIRKSYARKREIPDALVDQPDNFDDILEDIPESERTVSLEGPNRPPNFDDEERDYLSSEERRKRTADRMLGRSKRGLQMSPEAAAALLQFLNNGAYYEQRPDRERYPVDSYQSRPGSTQLLENEILQEILNQRGSVSDEEEEEGPSRHRFLPLPKVHVPTYFRNIL